MADVSSMLTVIILGAERTLPNYNVMGLAKASLGLRAFIWRKAWAERHTRKCSFGRPIKTLAASGISGFDKILGFNESSPLRRNVTIRKLAIPRLFLCSDFASGITGEITYVDGGMNTTVAGIVD